MIRIRVELIPNGDETKVRELATVKIVNVSKGPVDPDKPDEYEIEAFEASYGRTEEKRTFASFSHQRGAGVLACLAAALRSIGK